MQRGQARRSEEQLCIRARRVERTGEAAGGITGLIRTGTRQDAEEARV